MKVLVHTWNYDPNGNYGLTLYAPSAEYTHRYALWENIVGGDSGHPSCIIINNQLVIMTCTYGGWSGQIAGPNYLAYHTEINAAMTSLGGGYQLTEIDLSGFPTY
jgi:hypothetical protein